MIKVTPEGRCEIEGKAYPAVGFGTYKLTGSPCEKALQEALEVGYRIVDTATFYDNFPPVGKAIHHFDRDKCYVISKVWPDKHAPKDLEADIEKTLKELKMDHIDAYLLHWPNSKIPIEDSLNTLNSFVEKGWVRHIGISNPSLNHLKKALKVGVTLSWVQVEMSPNFFDAELIRYCHAQSIGVQGWAPLGRGDMGEHFILKEIAAEKKKTPSQIALKWAIQHRCVPLPKSSTIEHMKENYNSLGFTLSESEMERINGVAQNGQRTRYVLDEFDFSYEECWPMSKF